MIITVDIDYDDWIKVSQDIAIGLDYSLKPIKIVKSPSKRGYHIIWRTHEGRVNNLSWSEVSTELLPIVRKRLKTAEVSGIKEKGEKRDILRVVLGDDIFRVIYDIKRRDIMPQEVLFRKSNYYRGKRCKHARNRPKKR